MENIFRIKEILKQKGLTYNQLGDLVGLTKTSITRIVNGDQQPKADTMLAIANALDVDLRELFVSTRESAPIYVKQYDGSYNQIGSLSITID